MRRAIFFTLALGAIGALATPADAQQSQPETTVAAPAAASPTNSANPEATPAPAQQEKPVLDWKKGRPITMQYFRPQDKRGINVFETTKEAGVEYTGFKLDFNASFTSQVQNLSHSNTALPKVDPVSGVDANQLADIGFGFNNSTANLAVNAQLAPGIRVALTSYLSSRHHNETWVKDGYLQIDQSPVDLAPLKMLFEIATIRVGHMEINYGDAHFRRSDNGNAVYNPFVGNYIMDSFTTEIGGEVYLKAANVIAMGAITAGELRGTVVNPGQRGPAFIGKLGYDRQLNPSVRVRLTGSLYKSDKAASNTLYGGDRAGSRYYFVVENTAATDSAQFTSGAINPAFKNKILAMQINPFVKLRNLEIFGVIERAEGKALTEANDRTWHHYAVDAVYRFLANEDAFVGLRYNRAEGQLAGLVDDVGAKRWQLSAGWFLTPHVLMKAEYVNHEFFGYPTTNIRNGGKFDGMMLEGVIGF
jgi:hypothetical protein